MKNTRLKIMLAVISLLAIASSARADTGGDFDYTTYSTVMTAGLVVVGTIAAGIASIKAGVLVWGKVAKYFSKAG